MNRLLHFAVAAILSSFVALTLAPEALSKSKKQKPVSYPNFLVVDTVDPYGDSLVFKQIRAKLEYIEKTEHRKSVALVLCGGGAKGASEVGVLKYLEELNIPIDVICGTSIGGLVGGLYALGYNAEFIDSLMKNQDWGKILTDRIDEKYIPLSKKKYRERYQLFFPFHYAKDADKNEGEIDARRAAKFMAKEKSEEETQLGVKTVASSLPSGYAYGFNVNNLLSSLTVGYHDSTSFSKLPIPFCCVATDLVSCKAKNWGAGDLKKAMRSTMSIPALFSPVRTEGCVLVDGGLRNNFPTDIAKALGADIVIGIDLTDAYATVTEVNNAGTLVSQMISMLGRQSYEQTSQNADLYIHPNLEGYNMLSFNAAAIDSMIQRGYKAALDASNELKEIKAAVGNASTKYRNHRAIDINRRKVAISGMRVVGLPEKDAAVLLERIKLEKMDSVDAEMLEAAVSKIKASGAVESVTYSLLATDDRIAGAEEPFEVVFNCQPAPIHMLGFGLRLDTEVWAEVGLNLGINTRSLGGPKLNIDAKIGTNQSLDAIFRLDYPKWPAFNVEAVIANYNGTLVPVDRDDKKTVYGTGYWTHKEKIFISTKRFLKFDGEIGIKNEYFGLDEKRAAAFSIPYLDNEESLNNAKQGDYLGAYLKGNYYSLDHRYFPNKGMDLKFGYCFDFLKSGVSNFKPVHTASLDLRGAIPIGNRVAIIPDFHMRHIFNSSSCFPDEYDPSATEIILNPAFSISHHNFLGGTIQGRYIENQVPFVGFNNISLCSDYQGYIYYDQMWVLNLDVRVNIIKNLYCSALGGYAHMSDTMKNFFKFDDFFKDVFAAGLEVSYKTIFGPLKANFHWANRTGDFKNDWGFYLSAGFDF